MCRQQWRVCKWSDLQQAAYPNTYIGSWESTFLSLSIRAFDLRNKSITQCYPLSRRPKHRSWKVPCFSFPVWVTLADPGSLGTRMVFTMHWHPLLFQVCHLQEVFGFVDSFGCKYKAVSAGERRAHNRCLLTSRDLSSYGDFSAVLGHLLGKLSHQLNNWWIFFQSLSVSLKGAFFLCFWSIVKEQQPTFTSADVTEQIKWLVSSVKWERSGISRLCEMGH